MPDEVLTGQVYLGLVGNTNYTATLEYSFDISSSDMGVTFTVIDPATGETQHQATGSVVWD